MLNTNRNTSYKLDCKKSFCREIRFSGYDGKIYCNYYWLHASLTLNTTPIFVDDKALIVDILAVDFNGSIFPRGGERWEILEDKIDRKVQKIFDSVAEMGEPASVDGRDKCISKAVIVKLAKLGFEIESDNFFIDKKFKDPHTGSVVAEVTGL